MSDLRLLRIKSVLEKTDRSKTFVYREMKAGRFPKPGKYGRSSLWLESEIDAWIMQIMSIRNAA